MSVPILLRYGLNAQERDVWEVNSSNIGTYAHEVIRKFCDTVEDGANTNDDKIERWRNLSDEKRDDIIGGIINESCSNLLSSDVRDKERTANIFTRMGKTISNAAILVQKHFLSAILPRTVWNTILKKIFPIQSH